MKKKITAAALALVAFVPGEAYPPGSPMIEFGPRQVAVGVFASHSGQELFKSDLASSALNTAGFNMDYGPWRFLQFGAFVGASEFDVDVVDSQRGQADAIPFESDLSLSYGGSAKLATPRFLSRTTALVAYGSATRFAAEDGAGNAREGYAYSAGGGIHLQFWPAVNLIVGGELYAIDGEQTSRLVTDPRPFGNIDQYRGLLGLEFFFKGKNRPFISIAFRPTGSIGWDDRYGLDNASLSISLGSITSLPGKQSPDTFGNDDSDF